MNDIIYHHVRNVGKTKKDNYTFAIIPKDNTFFVGVAKCSRKDQFARKVGRAIASSRVQRYFDQTKCHLEDDRPIRGAFEIYFPPTEEIDATSKDFTAILMSEVRDISRHRNSSSLHDDD
jgi:transposase